MPNVTLTWKDDNTDLTSFIVRGSTTLQWPQDMPEVAITEPDVKFYEEQRQTNEPYYLHVTAERNGQTALSQEIAMTFPAQVMTELSVATCHRQIIGSIAENGALAAGTVKPVQNGPGMTGINLITKDNRLIYFLNGSNGFVAEIDPKTGDVTPLSQETLGTTDVKWAGLDSKGSIFILLAGNGQQNIAKVNLEAGTYNIVASLGASSWTRAAIDSYNDVIYLLGGEMFNDGKIPIGKYSIASDDYQTVIRDTDVSVSQAYSGWLGFAEDNSMGQVLIYWPGNVSHALKINTQDLSATHHDLMISYPTNSCTARNGMPSGGKIKFVGGGNIYTLDPVAMTVGTAPISGTLTDWNGGGVLTWAVSPVSATLLPTGDFLFIGPGPASALVVKGDFTTGYIVTGTSSGFTRAFVMRERVYALGSSNLWQIKWDGMDPMVKFPDSYYSGLSMMSLSRAIA